MDNIRKILVPTDYSDNAAVAYYPAQQLASQDGANVDFIHIIRTLHYFNKSIAMLNVPLDTDEELYPQLQKQAYHQIKKLMGEYIKAENRGKGIVQIAPRPSKEITEYAKRGSMI